jgi:hypothetical protein
MGLDLTSYDAALKQHYTNDMIEMMVYRDNPLLALMPKMEDFGGRNLPIVTIWGNPQGRSTSFTRAQARGAVTSSKLDDFLLTRVKDYSIATIDNETLEASKGNANAFLEAATVEIDGAINTLTRSVATAMYRYGYGEIGRIGAINTNTITLLNADEITNFEVGMELDLSGTLTGAVRDYAGGPGVGDALIVTSVNRSTGVLTFAANNVTVTIPGALVNDYIFVRGDHSGSTLTKIAGIRAWVPDASPAATAFFGVDRSVDTRLGGLRLDVSSLPIEEALTQGAIYSGREGAKLDYFFLNYANYSKVETALGTKVQYIDLKVNAEIAFRGIVVNGPKGLIRVIPDQNCPPDICMGVQMDTWKLNSLGKAVRVIDTDGLQMLRQANADGVEVRYGFYGNVGCRAPGYNINLKLA